MADLVHALKTLGEDLSGELLILEPTDSVPAWNALLQQQVSGQVSPLVAGQKRTRALVKCGSKQDVVKCIEFAVAHKMRVQAKGNAHHYGGVFNAESGIVVDLSGLKGVEVNAAERTAVVQPGTQARELYAAIIQHGLHFPGGHCTHVGLSGFILGGGLGWGSRHLGAACDNVVAMEVVLPTAEGGCKLSMITAESHPELFWGMRGAGGFLGIVTEFHVRLHPTPKELHVLSAMYPLECMEAVCGLWQQLMFSGHYPLTVEPSVAIFTDPSSGKRVACLSLVAFEDTKDVQACFDQVRSFLPEKRYGPLKDVCEPYEEALACVDPAWTWPGLTLYCYSSFVKKDRISADLFKKIEVQGGSMHSPTSLILVAPAASSPPQGSHSSAFGFRDHVYVVFYAMWPRTEKGPESDGDVQNAEWVRACRKAVSDVSDGTYFNETMFDEPGQVVNCYEPETYARLLKLKKEVDPMRLLMAL